MAILSNVAAFVRPGARYVWYKRGTTTWTPLAAFVLLCAGALLSQTQPPGEYEVKAAFLYNFAKFVDWPTTAFDRPNAPLRLCVLGSDPAYLALVQVVEGKKLNGRMLQVDRVRGWDQVKNCQVLFIGVSESAETMKILRGGLGEGILTVGETDGFAQAGGVINLVLRQNHIAFEINVSAANRAGLRISSKLLSLATIVQDDPESKRN